MKITIDVNAQELDKLCEEIIYSLQIKKLFESSDCVREIRIAQSCASILNPCWECAPKRSNWWAVDKSGEAWWYEEKPEVFEAVWTTHNANCIVAGDIDITGIDWKTTLRRRK